MYINICTSIYIYIYLSLSLSVYTSRYTQAHTKTTCAFARPLGVRRNVLVDLPMQAFFCFDLLESEEKTWQS